MLHFDFELFDGDQVIDQSDLNNHGTLHVTGSIANSALIANAGTIGGGGTFGDVTVGAIATHAPGLSPGIDTVDGDYTLAGTLEIELGGTTAGSGAGFHD